MTRRFPISLAAVLAAMLLTGALISGIAGLSASAAETQAVALAPAPALDEPLANASGSETAILSGGCFWGMQVVFQHVRGVLKVVSGYTGGDGSAAHYEDVGTGTTGHAESVEVVFDPHLVSYGTLLRVYFSVATDPTERDYQGPDQGSQYRGEIWPMNGTQSRIAQAYVHQLEAAHIYPGPIVTRIESARPFYPAEAYHQNFATLHPHNPYIMAFDAPKVVALAKLFPRLYVARPALLMASSSAAVAQQAAGR